MHCRQSAVGQKKGREEVKVHMHSHHRTNDPALLPRHTTVVILLHMSRYLESMFHFRKFMMRRRRGGGGKVD